MSQLFFFILRDTREAGISKYSGLLPKLRLPIIIMLIVVKDLKILLDAIMKQLYPKNLRKIIFLDY